MKNWTLELITLFQLVGIKKNGLVEMNENTYDFDPLNPKDSWLYPVLLGFLELRRQGFKVGSFMTIGTGSGIDSIAAYEIFKPAEIFQVDVHPNVPEIADRNVKSNLPSDINVQTFLGDLCEPFIKRKLQADLVYTNIPNIPSEEPVWEKKVSASRFMARDLEGTPADFQKWLLSLQYLALKQAKAVMKPSGIVVDAIGARVPYGILEKLFTELGYEVKELVSVYKIQSEPEDTLEGYAKAEKENNITFDFYVHEKAKDFWETELAQKDLTTPELKKALQPFRISATEALKDYNQSGLVPGHVCSILAGSL